MELADGAVRNDEVDTINLSHFEYHSSELIPQTTQNLGQGNLFYHFSLSHPSTNPPDVSGCECVDSTRNSLCIPSPRLSTRFSSSSPTSLRYVVLIISAVPGANMAV